MSYEWSDIRADETEEELEESAQETEEEDDPESGALGDEEETV